MIRLTKGKERDNTGLITLNQFRLTCHLPSLFGTLTQSKNNLTQNKNTEKQKMRKQDNK